MSETGSLDDAEVSEPKEELFEHVTDAYIRYTDVMFHWHKSLNPWHRNAVMALLNPKALVDPGHPLRSPGDQGITLYLGSDRLGKRRLLFSLRQLEYIQYYIHEMRLSNPEQAMSLSNSTHDSKEEKEDFPPGGGEWVPLPAFIMKADFFDKLEPLTLKTASELKKLTHQLTKHNGKADEDRLLANPTPSTINREAAKVDNATSGPGLRKGSTRAKSPTRRQRDKQKGAQEILDGENEGEETGWGGFPVKKPYASLDNSDLPGGAGIVTRGEVESHGLNIGEMTTTEGVMEAAGLEGMAKEGVTSPDLNIDKAVMTADKEPVIGEKVGIESSTATDQAHDVEDFKAMLATAETPLEAGKPVDSPLENFNTNYYFHAQQAYILASLGGLRGALEATPDEEAGPRSAIGRSLFLALDITTWEEDADVILEVGWAAVWWQQKLEAVEEEEAGFEEMQDRGHCVIQDYLLEKRNGHWRPNNRHHYLFGQSVPIARKNLALTVTRLIADLSKTAGGGPTYILVHSPDAGQTEFAKLGLDPTSWERRLKPSGWEYASYASPEGIGKTIVLDTAILFAAIEHDPAQLPAPVQTRKTLEEVAWIMFGQEKDRAPMFYGNAGNDAFYNLEVFLAIISGPPIEDLREDFQRSQQTVKADPQASVSKQNNTAQVVPSIPLNPISAVEKDVQVVNAAPHASKSEQDDQESAHSARPMPVTPTGNDLTDVKAINGHEEDDEDKDSETDMIKGVYFEDEKGNVVMME